MFELKPKEFTENEIAILKRMGFRKVNYYAKEYFINDHCRDLHAVSGGFQIDNERTFSIDCRSFVYDQIASDIEILRKEGIIK